ncbi:MAG: phosphodiester glycosidase family protein [Ruminococcus sp.]|nr:phosphodiester glycosidase family protein [Candidatus Copronaster equi]
MNKIVKSAICLAVSVSLVTPIVYFTSSKKKAAAEQTQTVQQSETTTTTTTTTTTVAPTTETTTQEITSVVTPESTTKAELTTQKQIFEKSNILKNSYSVQKWDVSNNGMSAHAEKIKVYLNKYVDGKKTNEKVEKYVYIAEITGAPSGFKTIAASQSTGLGVDTVANMAKKTGAVFAVNGEMCDHNKENYHGFYNGWGDVTTATVIKNSAVPQAIDACPSLTMNADGTWEYPVIVSPENVNSLISQGVFSTVSYTYPVIWRGQPYYTEGVLAPMWNERTLENSNASKHFYNDYTLVGQIDANHYVVTISDGFGRGYLIDMMNELGVQNAYWANGGHCSAMYIKGYGVVNRPNDHKLCSAADMMYF